MSTYSLPKQFRHWCKLSKLTPLNPSKRKSQWYKLYDMYGNTYHITQIPETPVHIIAATAQTGQVTKKILPIYYTDFKISIDNLKVLSII